MSDKLSLPISIIIAGLLIGGGIYLNGRIMQSARENAVNKATQTKQLPEDNLYSIMRPIDANDHIIGSGNARIMLIEYSDTECPFCKVFHSTMRSITEEYIKTEKVAWVYRHFPIESLHQKAFREAIALECAGSQGGNSAFWNYTNKIFEITPSNDGLEEVFLIKTAKDVGLDTAKFEICLNSTEFNARVQADIDDGLALRIDGTPTVVLLDTKTASTYMLRGAYPYEQLKEAIDLILES